MEIVNNMNYLLYGELFKIKINNFIKFFFLFGINK